MDAGVSLDINKIKNLSSEQIAWLDKQIVDGTGMASTLFGSKTWGDRLESTIAVDPNDVGKLEGKPIPEDNTGWTTTTPIPERDKNDGVMGTPISEQDKNAGVLPGSESNVGDWRDSILTSKGKEITAAANDLGYGQRIPPQKAPFNSHGQPVFWNGKNYITPDVDGHNVSNGWKVFDRKGNRVGTYDSELNRIKD